MFKKLLIICAVALAANITCFTEANTALKETEVIELNKENLNQEIFISVSPLKLVAQPQKYMGQKLKMNAKFDKFSTIGLDYEPSNKSSKEFISFLIKRDDVTDYNIPLSELKLIVKRDYAEKELVNLEAGDEIEIYGKVFCLALGDPWVEVEQVKILTVKENKDKKN